MNLDNDIALARQLALEINRQGGVAYYAGGYVRDKLMGIKSNDIDIEVYYLENEILLNILNRFGAIKSIGKSFNIFKLADLDIALPRIDIKTGTGHKGFKVIADPYLEPIDACKRRDFTCNAMLEDILSGEIYDYYGGENDIKNKILRMTDAHNFAQDPLRILRAARFASQLDFKVEINTIECAKQVDLRELAKERVAQETIKALLTDKPFNYFFTLQSMNQLISYYKELIGIDLKYLNLKAQLKNKYEDQLVYMVLNLIDKLNIDDSGILLNRIFSGQIFIDRVMAYKELSCTKPPNKDDYFDIYDECNDLDLAIFLQEKYGINYYDDYLIYLSKGLIKGEDLINWGYKPSKDFKMILKQINRELRYKNKEEILKKYGSCK